VIGIADGPGFKRLTIPNIWSDTRGGESIAINGTCLTVAEIHDGKLGFDIVQETLSLTNLGLLHIGDRVHVERALRVGDRIDGHFVQGHVDGTAKLLDKQLAPDCRLRIQSPPHLAKYLIPKGSICIDGVSLTIAAISPAYSEVALIPTTISRTELVNRPMNWPFNLEADVLAKTIISHLERQQSAS